MLRVKPFNEEVLYAEDRIVEIDRQDIAELVQRADRNPRQRIRICSHPGIDDNLHEMLIIHAQGTYVRPHKHLGKSESFHVVEGSVDVVLFDDHGGITRVIPMSDYRSGAKFYYRLSDPYYHTLLIRSDHLVFHEITNGPFDPADTVFAPWAPDPKDDTAAKDFMDKLAALVDKFASLSKKTLSN
jgi:cupin fold WbuC family metalloprotein